MHTALQTQRLTLRPLKMEDAGDFARLVDNPAICRMTGTFPTPFPAASAYGLVEIFRARAATGHGYHWAIIRGDTFIGVIGIYHQADGWGLGYWLGEPFWGKGLAGEAIAGLVEHLRRTVPGLHMKATVFTDNPASAKLLRRVGFVQADATRPGYSLARRGMAESWDFTWNEPVEARADRVATERHRS